MQHSIHRHAKHGGRPHSLPVSLPRRCSICLADETRPLPICVASHLPVWFCSEAAMLGGNEPQWTKPPKPVRRRGAQPAPELDARAAEMRLRQSSTKEETERIEEHLRLLRSVELSGPATPTWIAVTAYLILIVACATSRIASAAGLDAIVSTALAKVSRCQARHFRWRARAKTCRPGAHARTKAQGIHVRKVSPEREGLKSAMREWMNVLTHGSIHSQPSERQSACRRRMREANHTFN